MGVITFHHQGDFKKTVKLLNTLSNGKYLKDKLDKFGKMGVEALSAATPVDTGKTSQSWTYLVEVADNQVTINWENTNVNKHINIAIILDTGHGTRNGGYVTGYHYIEPAIQPVFDKIIDAVWKEVTSG